MLISPQLYTYGGKGRMYCISGGTYFRFPGRLIFECWSHWGGKEKGATSGFGLKVMFGGSLFVSGQCTLKISCGTRYKIAYDNSAWYCCRSNLIHYLPCARPFFDFNAHSTFNLHTWKIGRNTWRETLFRMQLTPHHNLTALMERYNCSKRQLMSKDGPWPPSILAAVTTKESFPVLR